MTINVHFALRITNVNFYWSSLIRKEKREQNSVIYKNNLVSSRFLWIRWRSSGLRTTNQMIWDFNENNRQNVKEETHGVNPNTHLDIFVF